MRKKTFKQITLLILLVLLVIPFLIPERAQIPVEGATHRDWNEQSFWYEPWGVSGVHKGIDIFAPTGRPVLAPVGGIVLYKGHVRLGGNVVAVLGPKWRIHYCAHLNSSSVRLFEIVKKGEVIGSAGTSGNAASKASHLHYAVISLLPRIWKVTGETQGWKKMFFVDPNEVIGSN